jgi:O-antigen ligase
MEITTSRSVPRSLPRRLAGCFDPPALAAWTLAFAVVAYLALSNGGYDTIVRSQVGIAVWWIVLLGALAGVLPARIGAAGWVAIGLLAAFALWTGLATGWSESSERTVVELGREATYLGVLVLAIALQGRTAARHTIDGLACAIGFVTLLAVLSRLHPQWFPVNDQLQFLGAGAARKLSYPLNYWNALACFAAMGVPLLLGVALRARTLGGQALAAAMLPLSALCVYLTISRGGTLALVVGIVVFLVFVPRRLDALGTLLVAGIGSAILISAASQRDALQDGVATAAAIHQGTQLIWLAVVVCGGVALLQVAMGLAARYVERPAWLAPTRRGVVLRSLLVVTVVCVVGVAAGVPRYANDRWQEFKAPVGAVAAGSQDNVFSRLSAANGNNRYQMWQSAQDANATDPMKGIGPGTFEFWWARHATASGFVRDAHSLYFETLAETGIVGLVLLGGLLAFLLIAAIARSLRAAPALRILIAGAVGSLATFMSSAVFEWVWEMAAIAAAVLIVGAVIVVGRDEVDIVDEDRDRRRFSLGPRAAYALLALAALGAVAVPMVGALASRESHDAAAAGHVAAALQESRTAERVQPYAATPRLQRALVLERAGALSKAASAARAATVEEPTNWRPWLVLARVDARRGSATSALRALREARRLNPRSPLFARTR